MGDFGLIWMGYSLKRLAMVSMVGVCVACVGAAPHAA